MVDEYLLHLYSLASKLTVKMKPMTGKGNKPSEVFFLEEKKNYHQELYSVLETSHQIQSRWTE